MLVRKRMVRRVRDSFSQSLPGSPMGWKLRLRLWKQRSRQRGRQWLAQNTAFRKVDRIGAGDRLDGRRLVSKTGAVAKGNVWYQMSFRPTQLPIRNTHSCHCAVSMSFCLVLLTLLWLKRRFRSTFGPNLRRESHRTARESHPSAHNGLSWTPFGPPKCLPSLVPFVMRLSTTCPCTVRPGRVCTRVVPIWM